MRAALSLLLVALPPTIAAFASPRGGKRAAPAGGRGFGTPSTPPPPPPSSKRRGGKVAEGGGSNGGSSLKRKLREQHADNCAQSARLWTVCDDDSALGEYDGGWSALAPSPPLSPDNFPYGTDRLLLKSKAPLLTEAECEALIGQMEEYGAANGWDARYPVAGFTREVNVADIPASVELLNEALRTRLLPAVAREYKAFPASSLRVNEALVVKYDAASGANCLPVHQDFSYLTINVALSETSDFTGGGTWFQHNGETVVAGRGEAVVHPGILRHCGVPVESGSRYQLVLFILSTEFADLSGRMQAIGAAAGAKAAGELMDVALSSSMLEAACKVNPLDTESWSQLAHNRRHDGDLTASARAFERVVDLSGARDFAALCSLAAVRSQQDEHEAALDALERALSLGAPPSPSAPAEMLSAQHNVGMALMALERHEDAGLVFESVIDADPDAADSWAALGVVMAKLEQTEAALACQKQVLRIRGGGSSAGTAAVSSAFTAATTTTLPPLAGTPWLARAAFAPSDLAQLADDIDGLPLRKLALVKAFQPENDADAAFGSPRPPIQWACERDACARICDRSLGEALEETGAPMSARVAATARREGDDGGGAVGAETPTLDRWLLQLQSTTERPIRDADAYLTSAASSSASLGWHVDDIDVLLVMLRGRKRFRVAGETAGSAVVIDHLMEAGDAIYIPALTFHSGGDSSAARVAEGSTLLSVAMPPWPCGADASARASEGVAQWRRAREAMRRALPSAGSNTWEWAASAEGARLVARTLGQAADFAQFVTPPPTRRDADTTA